MKSFKYLYGPVPSRRLGSSLGIDLIPHKVCTYNCIYCQIGKTTLKTLLREEYLPVNEILKEVEIFIRERNVSVDYLSLSGSGEPTLHSGIGKVIEGIKAITSLPVAVITNGALLYDESVRKDLLNADLILPSMDAVSDEVFKMINRPHSDLSVEKMIGGLIDFRGHFKGQIWLEILFCKGVNDKPEELKKMKEAIKMIHPERIHLNTVVRPPSEEYALPLNQNEMEEIRTFFGEKASIISEFDRHPLFTPERNIEEKILKILKRRPLSLSDLSRNMGIAESKINSSILLLIKEGFVRKKVFGNSIFYEVIRMDSN